MAVWPSAVGLSSPERGAGDRFALPHGVPCAPLPHMPPPMAPPPPTMPGAAPCPAPGLCPLGLPMACPPHHLLGEMPPPMPMACPPHAHTARGSAPGSPTSFRAAPGSKAPVPMETSRSYAARVCAATWGQHSVLGPAPPPAREPPAPPPDDERGRRRCCDTQRPSNSESQAGAAQRL